MMFIRILISAFLLFTSYVSCVKPQPQYSPLHPEQKIVISGHIEEYDFNEHPVGIQLSYVEFCMGDLVKETYFLEEDGNFRFDLKNNIAQDYLISFGNKVNTLLIIPGDSVYLNFSDLRLTGDLKNESLANPQFEYQIKASSPITDQSLRLEPLLYDDTLEHAFYNAIFSTNDLDSINAICAHRENEIQNKLNTIIDEQKLDDPILLDWINQMVKYKYNSQIFLELIGQLQKAEPDERELLYQFVPALTRDFDEGEKSVYHSFYQYFVHHFDMVQSFRYAEETRAFSNTKNYEGLAALRIEKIHEQFNGFQEEMLLSSYIGWMMQQPEHFDIEAYVEDFIRQSDNDHFSRVLGEHYSEIIDSNAYESISTRVMSIDQGLDNILIEIIAQNPDKVIVLDFWATWCGPCLGAIEHLYPSFIPKFDPDDVAFIFLAIDSPRSLWRKRISEMQFTANHYLLNNEQKLVMDRIFEIKGLPHHVIINRTGSIIKNRAPGPGKQLEKLIASCIAG